MTTLAALRTLIRSHRAAAVTALASQPDEPNPDSPTNYSPFQEINACDEDLDTLNQHALDIPFCNTCQEAWPCFTAQIVATRHGTELTLT